MINHTHLRVRVCSELEGLDGESQGLVCPRDEPRRPRVALTVQHTAVDNNNMTLKNPNQKIFLKMHYHPLFSPKMANDAVFEG